MAGYWNRPDETAKVMTADGYFRTGDIGVMTPDGYTKIVDRKKDMILVSGFNVYPNEIEEVIASHPGVLECAVIGVAGRQIRRSRQGVRRQEGPEPHRRGHHQVLRHAADQLQGPEADRVQDRPAEDQCRKDPAPRSCATKRRPRRPEARTAS